MLFPFFDNSSNQKKKAGHNRSYAALTIDRGVCKEEAPPSCKTNSCCPELEFKTVCFLRNHRNEVHVAARMPPTPPEGSIKNLMHYFCKHEEKQEERKRTQTEDIYELKQMIMMVVSGRGPENVCCISVAYFWPRCNPANCHAPHKVYDGCKHFVTLPETGQLGAKTYKKIISQLARGIESLPFQLPKQFSPQLHSVCWPVGRPSNTISLVCWLHLENK